MTTYYVDGAAGNDSNAGTSAGAGNAWATVGHALGAVAGGDLVNVKASAVYSISSTLAAGSGAGSVSYGNPTRVVGYTTTPGDGGRATVRTTAAVAAITVTVSGWSFESLTLDGNSVGTRGVDYSAPFGAQFVALKVQNFTGEGFYVSTGNYTLTDSEITGCGGTNGAVDVQLAGQVSGCRIHDNTGNGVATTAATITNCRIYANGGKGVKCTNFPSTILGCTIHGNTGDGVTVAANYVSVLARNNILTSNGGYGINASAKGGAGSDPAVDYNWYGTGSLANTSGARSANLSAGPHDLSGDPGYADATNGDFNQGNSALKAGSP